MKTELIRDRNAITLIIDDDAASTDLPNKLAEAIRYADSPCWIVTDIRLSRYRSPGPYATSISADDFHSELLPGSPDEEEFIKSSLREYRQDPDGSINWCSYDGIVRGFPHVNGYTPPSYKDFHHAGYFSRREALELLREIKLYWDAYSGDPAKAKILNPYWQPNLNIVQQKFRFHRFMSKLA